MIVLYDTTSLYFEGDGGTLGRFGHSKDHRPDLKQVILAVVVDAQGRPISFQQFSFSGFSEWAANLPPCLIAMEACSSHR